jgi:hypothetical protein
MFCQGLDLEAIRALAGPVTLRQETKPGDKLQGLPGKPPITATGFGCYYATDDRDAPGIAIGYSDSSLAEARSTKEKAYQGQEGCTLAAAPDVPAAGGFVAGCTSVHELRMSRGADLATYLAIGSGSRLSCQVQAAEDPLPVDAGTLTDFCLEQAHTLAKS